MVTLNESIRTYTELLKKGDIRIAYRGILAFMAELKTDLERCYPEMLASALYVGTMDMTYFALTPQKLKALKLKIAIVYLHQEARFEIWLAGNNRKIQADMIKRLKHTALGDLKLSSVAPGVDSIVYKTLDMEPDFDNPEILNHKLTQEFTDFVLEMVKILET